MATWLNVRIFSAVFDSNCAKKQRQDAVRRRFCGTTSASIPWLSQGLMDPIAAVLGVMWRETGATPLRDYLTRPIRIPLR
jgi:hypothetical protein